MREEVQIISPWSGRGFQVDQNVVRLNVSVGDPELVHLCKTSEELIAELLDLPISLFGKFVKALLVDLSQEITSRLEIVPAEVDRQEITHNV